MIRSTDRQLDRREFLKKAAMAGTGFAVLPALSAPATACAKTPASEVPSGPGRSEAEIVAAGPSLAAALSSEKAMSTPSISLSPASTGQGVALPQVNMQDLRKVTDNILCAGGCGLTVAAGELTPCEVAKRMNYRAAVYIAPSSEGGKGMTPQQALDRFAKDFGQGILAAPPKSGFDLIAWVLPFAGLGLGIALVGRTLINWRSQQPAVEQTVQETDTDMLSRIEDEVKKL
jgi:hypothetical protein